MTGNDRKIRFFCPDTPARVLKMYSISYLRRQVESLRRRLEPVLDILRLRNLALEFCDEFDEAAV